ncbi:hypothetical protein PDL09_24275 [Bacillus cereus]|nr:hypothetical protein [Bacillus cereus]
MKSHHDITLEQACNAIMALIKEESITEVDTIVITENEQHDTRFNEGLKFLL